MKERYENPFGMYITKMNCLEQNCFEWMSCILQRNLNVIEEGESFQKISEVYQKMQINEGSNIPPMSVKHGQVLYTSSRKGSADRYQTEEEVQDHLESLSSEEKEVIKNVMERDRRFQREIAKEFPQISVQSPLIIDIFNLSKEKKFSQYK